MVKADKLVKIIKNFLQHNQVVLYLLIFFISFYFLLWLHSTPTFLDPDSFYHLKITKLISQQGPVIDFPWLQYTVLTDYFVDHHFLYHVLGIPFIMIFGDLIGYKLYTVFLACGFIMLVYLFFKKEQIKYAEILCLVLLFAPAFVFRLALTKAVAFSLILLFLGIFCLFRKKYWLLIIISFFYVWSYGGFLLILVMTIFYILADIIYDSFININLWQRIKRKFGRLKLKDYLTNFYRKILDIDNFILIECSFIGVIAGLIINPYFPQNLKFYWQQIFQIGLINYRGAVNVGGEWYPYAFNDLISNCGVASIFLAVSLILFFIFIKKQKPQSIFFLFATIFFFLLTLKSKRYVEYFVPFAMFFSAYSLTYSLAKINLKNALAELKKQSYFIGVFSHFLLIYVSIVFPIIMLKDAYLVRQQYQGGFSLNKFSGIAAYIEKDSQPGDIVLHTSWDDFPMLFYHNDYNYYIVGLDPTFMYNYDPDLYNLYADITTGQKIDNLYQTIQDNFQAQYVIVNKNRDRFANNLINDGNFLKVYEDDYGTVFRLK